MPYDPYAPVNPWWTQQQAPQQGAQFSPPPAPVQQKQWWQGVPMPKSQTGKSDDPSKPQPSLLQLLMLGGKPTYSGTPTGGAAPSGSYGAIPGAGAGGMNMGANPWAWLGNYFGGGGGTPGAT